MRLLVLFVCCAAMCAPAHAEILSVTGPDSSDGVAATEIAAPLHALEDFVENSAQQGFDEAQDVTTTVAYTMDDSVLAIGSYVDSHMIFLNTEELNLLTTHYDVEWTFSGTILGVMSDYNGNLEVASTPELGAPGTNYTTPDGTIPTGAAPPFAARGFETNYDAYSGVGTNVLTVSMGVTEPGDWIRVITTGEPVPEPASLALMGISLVGLVAVRRHRRNRAA